MDNLQKNIKRTDHYGQNWKILDASERIRVDSEVENRRLYTLEQGWRHFKLVSILPDVE